MPQGNARATRFPAATGYETVRVVTVDAVWARWRHDLRPPFR
ncbi:hypothetical protein ABZV34_20465 [Streptomyces sp. NPDC005195]